MEQNEDKGIFSVQLDAEVKRWLVQKSVERQLAGLPLNERSMGAVIRDLIDEARKRDEQERAA